VTLVNWSRVVRIGDRQCLIGYERLVVVLVRLGDPGMAGTCRDGFQSDAMPFSINATAGVGNFVRPALFVRDSHV